MAFSFFYQYLDNVGFLILAAAGLIIIFGMMGVINMAHGELMMIGAYTTASSYHAGVPTVLAVVLGGLAAGLVGVVLERLVIRRFYNQLLSSMVVTWGISLVLSQGFLAVFGPSTLNVPTPFSSFAVGEQTYAVYRMVMAAVAILLVAAVWVLFTYTAFGVRARATMENPKMAAALGTNAGLVYSLTFGLGAFLGGIAGGMFALTATITPFFGQNYTPLAFITVVVGGAANPITGLVAAAFSMAGIQTGINNLYSVYVGYIAMFAAAIALLVVLPKGISEYLEKRKLGALRKQA
jgi:branched-subunit amino acid ABC-type transport system permease component